MVICPVFRFAVALTEVWDGGVSLRSRQLLDNAPDAFIVSAWLAVRDRFLPNIVRVLTRRGGGYSCHA